MLNCLPIEGRARLMEDPIKGVIKELKAAMTKIVYPADYYVVMLSIPARAALRQVAEEIPNAFLWDAKDIARKLKNYPAIVEDFFGAAWREAFCG